MKSNEPKTLKIRGNALTKELECLAPGDLICVDWTDASIGKSLGSGLAVDIPVKSWGVFVGALGQKTKHIILAQNNFLYSDGVYDVDYTAVPIAWTNTVTIIAKEHLKPKVARDLLNSFMIKRGHGRRRGLRRISSSFLAGKRLGNTLMMQRISNHVGLIR